MRRPAIRRRPLSYVLTLLAASIAITSLGTTWGIRKIESRATTDLRWAPKTASGEGCIRLRGGCTARKRERGTGTRIVDVLIIGGGAAGMSAARALVDHEPTDGIVYRPMILEARKRLGGRAHTLRLPARPEAELGEEGVDLGCNYIHGANPRHPVFQIANATDAVLGTVSGGFWEASELCEWWWDGIRIPSDIVARAELWRMRVENRLRRLASINENRKKSFGDLFLQAEFEEFEEASNKINNSATLMPIHLEREMAFKMAQKAYGYVAALNELKPPPALEPGEDIRNLEFLNISEGSERIGVQFEIGANENKPPRVVRAKFPGIVDPERGHDLLVLDGYQPLLQTLLQPRGSKSDSGINIRLGQVVKEITVSDDGKVWASCEGPGTSDPPTPMPTTSPKMLEEMNSTISNKIDMENPYVWVNDVSLEEAEKLLENIQEQARDGDEDSKRENVPQLYLKLETRIARLRRESRANTTASPRDKSFSAEFAICTLPIGVLKKGSVRFDPPLPKAQKLAISRIGSGAHNKVVFRFARKDIFWPKASPNFNSPDPCIQWLNLHAYGKCGVIVAHIWPPYAYGYDGDSDETVSSKVLDVLHSMFLNSTTSKENIPKPVDSIVTRWDTDPYSLGSYSFKAQSMETGDYLSASQPHPIADPKVVFAGEATSTMGTQCVLGAYLTGRRAAREVEMLGARKRVDHTMVELETIGAHEDPTSDHASSSE
ncbi:hypothetical protein AAMO2058_000958300 [Amorphochlora amoebiformis]